jgi:hypothetical protein
MIGPVYTFLAAAKYQIKLKINTPANKTTAKFIDAGVTGVAGGQKLKNQSTSRKMQAKMLLITPSIPGMRQRPHTRFPGPTYSVVMFISFTTWMSPLQRRHSSKAQHIR